MHVHCQNHQILTSLAKSLGISEHGSRVLLVKQMELAKDFHSLLQIRGSNHAGRLH